MPATTKARKHTPAATHDRGDARIDIVIQLAERYQISSIGGILDASRAAAERTDLGIAVLGRFKAGKSSFLNHFIGRDLLPIGVVPVTSVITEIEWGSQERFAVRFIAGHEEFVHPSQLPAFITESSNPENHKAIDRVVISLPELAGYCGLRFIDTPGLESAFAHNSDVSLNWIPNVDVALVAIGVDPPLSQQDVSLIRKLLDYTSTVCVLLTKVDVLNESERTQVLDFVRGQLNKKFQQAIEVFPYSIRQGFEWTREALEEKFFLPKLASMREQKAEILDRKVQTLIRDCGNYVRLHLTSAQLADSERQRLRQLILTDNHTCADGLLELQLVTQHVLAKARTYIETVLKPEEARISKALLSGLEVNFPTWDLSFGKLLARFEDWIREQMPKEITGASQHHKDDFAKPLRDLRRQYTGILQAFRDRISEQTLETFGVSMQTTETEIEIPSPKYPDIRIGRIFDHNWELLSPVVPTRLLRGALNRRFKFRVEEETYKNLSRLSAQWLDIISASAHQMQKEAEKRISDLIATIDRLTAAPATDIHQIRLDLQKLDELARK